MGAFISMLIVNVVGGAMLLTGTTFLAPIIGVTSAGIRAYSLAAVAHSWYGGALSATSVLSLLMARVMG